jgi:hypothetical protein
MESLFLFLNMVFGFIFGRIFRLFSLGTNPFV